MCVYPVVQYTIKHQEYVPVSSCTVHDKTSVICASIQFYSTRWNIRTMCQYLVVQYTINNQKYVPVSSCTVHSSTSEICISI
jgi:hypothetical protein